MIDYCKNDVELTEALTHTRAIHDVLAERRRQIIVEGFAPEDDDRYTDRSLVGVAAAYTYFTYLADSTRAVILADNIWKFRFFKQLWPVSWDIKWWKPKDRRTDLVKATALLIAEIERLDRVESKYPRAQVDSF